jgi:DNA-binding NarL/FixJ family response regulator
VALSVVIVDDSEAFLASARALLGRQGLPVVGVATSPAEALDRVRELRPDVVVVDLHLGSDSGLELARRLSADDASSPAVVLVSTIAREDLAALVVGSPVRGFLTKTDLSATALESIVSGAGLPG